jgi:hypothetical protein
VLVGVVEVGLGDVAVGCPHFANDLVDDNGLGISGDVFWEFVPAFTSSTLEPQVEDDDLPRSPHCSFTWPTEGGLSVVIDTAGNWQGCERHRTVRHALPSTPQSVPGLPEVLTQIEDAARSMDPDPLIHCTTEGSCSVKVRRRAAELNRRLAWSSKLVEARRSMSMELRAELEAWENEHLRHNNQLGTSDWPGWASLIGPPPPDSTQPSTLNTGVPVDVLRPVLGRRDASLGSLGLWSMLVSYYWSSEADRTVKQLHEHRPQDAAETDDLVQELSAVGLVRVVPRADGKLVVSINVDALSVVQFDTEANTEP